MPTTQWSLHAKERLYQRYGYTYIQEPMKQIPELLDERMKTVEIEKLEKVLFKDDPCFLVRINFYDIDCKLFLIYNVVDSLILTVLPTNCMRFTGEVEEHKTINLRHMIRLNLTVDRKERTDQLRFGELYLYTVDYSIYTRGEKQKETIDLLSAGQESHEKRKWIFAANSQYEIEQYLERRKKPNERLWINRMFVSKPNDPEVQLLDKL